MDGEASHNTGFHSIDLRRTEGGDFIETPGSVHGPRCPAAEQAKSFRIDRKQPPVENARELEIRTGRI